LLRFGKQDVRRTPGTDQRRNIDLFGGYVRPHQLGSSLFRKRNIQRTLIPLFYIISRLPMAQQINFHSVSSPFKTVGIPQNTRMTVSAFFASKQASRPAASRAARSSAVAGTMPPPT